jgi:hypothetical protein
MELKTMGATIDIAKNEILTPKSVDERMANPNLSEVER